MPHPSLTIVCLPHGTPTHQLATTAAHRLAATPLTNLGSAGHFTVTTRLHRGSLLQPWRDTAAGGPVRLLNLNAMRAAAHRASWHRWHIWNQVVEGTRPAQPYWTFLERHRADPARYPIAKARQHYLAQPRVAAMLTYNALPTRITDVPTSHLEAFQVGANGYASHGWLSAIAGNRFLCLDGTFLVNANDQYAAQVRYLTDVNRRVDALNPRDILVALCTG
ncbi:hypothetical protein V6V47_13710 [Micromonospora sp. CPCC 205539]|uniref:hypothetical protein n=1 Tax=Micromonospora sp. CPCC 205539 TaxID=3122408 RepID=UPI002FEF0E33